MDDFFEENYDLESKITIFSFSSNSNPLILGSVKDYSFAYKSNGLGLDSLYPF